MSIYSIVIVTVWWTIGFNFVLYLAGLQDIPRELYEASAIDGASPWQQIRGITIPLLARTTTLVVTLQVIASLKVFDQMYIMTSGGPNFATRSILELIYDEGFTNFDAAALGEALEEEFRKQEGVDPKLAKCVSEGVAGISQSDAESMVFEKNLKPIEEIAESCK